MENISKTFKQSFIKELDLDNAYFLSNQDIQNYKDKELEFNKKHKTYFDIQFKDEDYKDGNVIKREFSIIEDTINPNVPRKIKDIISENFPEMLNDLSQKKSFNDAAMQNVNILVRCAGSTEIYEDIVGSEPSDYVLAIAMEKLDSCL
ncbi:MAG: hypothetical protein ACI870_000025 [Crocinitomicaceae bacterium]|jgi:hypothetical protein